MNKVKNAEYKSYTAREKELLQKRKRLRIFPLVSLVIAGMLLLLMLAKWAAVYNSASNDYEIAINGFNCVAGGLSGEYTSAETGGFGELSTFYYHAGEIVPTLCALSVAVLFLVVAHALIQLFALITNKQGVFNIVSIVFSAAIAAMFFACYSVALSMEGPVIEGYCYGNPDCSIHSQAILAGLFALLSISSPVLAMVLDKKSKRALRAEAEAAEQRSLKANKPFRKNKK